MRYPRWRLTLAVALVAALLMPLVPVAANGPHAGAREVFSGAAGPYDIRVFSTHAVGNLHLSVFVTPPGSASPASDVSVEVSAERQRRSAQTAGPSPAVRSLSDWHSTYLLVEDAGEWLLTITLAGPRGAAAVDIPIEVLAPESTNWGLWGAVAFFILVAVWLIFEMRRRKSHRREPGA